ncbi:MAG: SDR family NAD(P)-dependent oxidoreductase [Alphaproteobacteria bacterium]|nr:SDR family NAD(P)-dependent oxidoreductase [Alphaproteobacteria bacterium]
MEKLFQPRQLLCLGFGYTARAFYHYLQKYNIRIIASYRTKDKQEFDNNQNLVPFQFDFNSNEKIPEKLLEDVDSILISIPPTDEGDLVISKHREWLLKISSRVKWIGYLSATSVYGDWQGKWVDEKSNLLAQTERGKRRIKAEKSWMDLWQNFNLPIHIFRLAGIYGPGRNVLEDLVAQKARHIIKPGQVFNRIYIDDLIKILSLSLAYPTPGKIYNICDDLPCFNEDILNFATNLLTCSYPLTTDLNDPNLTPMIKSFYVDNKRISNHKMKVEFGVQLDQPTYKQGLITLYNTNKNYFSKH